MNEEEYEAKQAQYLEERYWSLKATMAEIEANSYISKTKIREKAQEYDKIGMIGVSRAFEELLKEE